MAVHFHKIKVKSIRRETQDCVSIVFDIPEKLAEEFKFSHGQNITLKALINEEETRRSYSICSSPFENELRIAVKKADNGLFSTYINNDLKQGDVLELLPPTGKFNTKLDEKNKKNYLAFVAGSGITPVISIIKTTLQTEPLSSFTLLYGSRSRSSIIFFEELQALKNMFITRFNLINILSREKTETPVNYGRINKEKLFELKKLIQYKSFDDFFICGPAEMIFAVKDFLITEGIDDNKIHFELFSVPGEKQKQSIQVKKNSGEGGQSNIIIKADGRTFDFMLPFNSINILDAALQQGADLPFACKGGVCCSCKAKLTEGKVAMDANYALEKEEIEKGFILCCQSHPVTEKVVIDFDIK
jgi:ring-1,2-phenylacetyl-CoA epoxidase subunit PaaE